MKQVKLIKEIKHPKGDIPRGTVFNWNEETSFYEFSKNGIVISTINEAGLNTFTDLFEKI